METRYYRVELVAIVGWNGDSWCPLNPKYRTRLAAILRARKMEANGDKVRVVECTEKVIDHRKAGSK